MTTDARIALLAHVLDSQPLDPAPLIDADRMRAALTTGPALTEVESRRLWASPATRDQYFRLRAEVRAETSGRLGDHGVDRSLQALAASSDDTVHHFTGPSFSVTVIQADLPDVDWLISLKLDPAYREHLPPMMPVTLRDSGGLVWITGRPDRNGTLNGEWTTGPESPLDRARIHTLFLDP